MSEPPNMTQSSNSTSGLEPSIDVLLEKALEKVVNNAIVQINEATTKAIEMAVKNSVENVLGNAVESAVEDAVATVVESAVENAIEDAVQNAVESAVQNTVEDAVEKALEKAVEKSMARYLARSQILVPSHPTEQRDANQNLPESDVVSEIPETQQGSMEIETVTENSTETTNHNVEDDTEREEATLDDLFARDSDYIRHNPWPEETFVIEHVQRF